MKTLKLLLLLTVIGFTACEEESTVSEETVETNYFVLDLIDQSSDYVQYQLFDNGYTYFDEGDYIPYFVIYTNDNIKIKVKPLFDSGSCYEVIFAFPEDCDMSLFIKELNSKLEIITKDNIWKEDTETRFNKWTYSEGLCQELDYYSKQIRVTSYY